MHHDEYLIHKAIQKPFHAREFPGGWKDIDQGVYIRLLIIGTANVRKILLVSFQSHFSHGLAYFENFIKKNMLSADTDRESQLNELNPVLLSRQL